MLSNLVARWISPFLKAHAAGVLAAGALLIADLSRGTVTSNDVYAVLGAYLGVGAGVAIIPNTPTLAPAVDMTPQDVPAAGV